MEQPKRSMKLGEISFQRSRSVPSQIVNERMQRIDEQQTGTERSKGKAQLSKCYPLNIPDSPHEAMEFLSRSWSSSSANFFQILSTNSIVTSHENSESDEAAEGQDKDKGLIGYNQSSFDQLDQLLAALSDLKSNHPAHQKHTTIQSSRVLVGNMKSWLREELFSSLSKNCRRKRKEVLRFHEAQVHAVLAVTRLAAAIAGMVANSNIETSYISSNRSCLSKQREGAVNETNTVVASAAALVATVCAEAAEAIGAKRNQVTSAIKMGLESWSSCDMLTLTATAATCLRGAATLKQRAESNSSLPEGYKFLQRGAIMHLCMPTGKVHLKLVSVYLKNDRIMLRWGTRHLRGAFTTYEESEPHRPEPVNQQTRTSLVQENSSSIVRTWFEMTKVREVGLRGVMSNLAWTAKNITNKIKLSVTSDRTIREAIEFLTHWMIQEMSKMRIASPA